MEGEHETRLFERAARTETLASCAGGGDWSRPYWRRRSVAGGELSAGHTIVDRRDGQVGIATFGSNQSDGKQRIDMDRSQGRMERLKSYMADPEFGRCCLRLYNNIGKTATHIADVGHRQDGSVRAPIARRRANHL